MICQRQKTACDDLVYYLIIIYIHIYNYTESNCTFVVTSFNNPLYPRVYPFDFYKLSTYITRMPLSLVLYPLRINIEVSLIYPKTESLFYFSHIYIEYRVCIQKVFGIIMDANLYRYVDNIDVS